MRILIIQETDWLKRGPHQQHHLAEIMSLRGHEIRVIDYELLWRSESKRGIMARREVFRDVSKIHDNAGVSVVRPPMIKLPLLDNLSILLFHTNEINRQIEEFVPDVIIGFSIINSYLADRAAHRKGIPFVYYWIDVLHRLVPFKPFQPLAKIIEAKVLKTADRVLVINEELRDCVIKMGAPAGKTGVVKAGIDLTKFVPAGRREIVRAQYGLVENDIVLFFMGWLYHFSGLKEVVAELARENHPGVKLLIVGDGDAYTELVQLKEKYNLGDKLILAGRKTYQEIPGFIEAADICLLPAYPNEKIMQDIVPIKMYEYMAMSKPVISTSLPGIKCEFGDSNGVVYVDKPEDVVERAVALIKGDNLDKLGSRARDFAQKNSWDKVTDELESILEEVSGGNNLRPLISDSGLPKQ